jgi:hypothetical protein
MYTAIFKTRARVHIEGERDRGHSTFLLKALLVAPLVGCLFLNGCAADSFLPPPEGQPSGQSTPRGPEPPPLYH